MNQEIKARWVAALRSGEYVQGKYVLKRAIPGKQVQYTYCCLGVLFDLWVQENCPNWEDVPATNNICFNQYEKLPKYVMEWAGLRTSVPHVRISSGRWTDLAKLNDGSTGYPAVSFDEIADEIERNL